MARRWNETGQSEEEEEWQKLLWKQEARIENKSYKLN